MIVMYPGGQSAFAAADAKVTNKDLEDSFEKLLKGIFLFEAGNRARGFFEHIGLTNDATWEQFRRHYDDNGSADCFRALDDQIAYPPSFEILQGAAKTIGSPEKVFSDFLYRRVYELTFLIQG